MADQTPILQLPYILPAQAQKHVTHNEALRLLDIIVQLAVINRTLGAPPASPSIGDRHIVGAPASGAWTGQTAKIAVYTQTGWEFVAPRAGWQAFVQATTEMVAFDGSDWAASGVPSVYDKIGVNTAANTTNRLAVSSPATLLTHDGSGHQVKVNKAGMGDTASLLFQTGFSGRAEMGLAGNDDFSVKVSANGTSFATALAASAATGSVTLPQPVRLGGQASDPASPANGTLWLNTTSGEVRLRSAGATVVVGGGVTDGDKGDIAVSGGGAAWTIDAGAVTLGKMADVATGRLIGRSTAGTGAPEAMTAAQVRVLLNVADGAQVNVPTDLTYAAGTRTLNSSTGADVVLPLADTGAAGLAPARSGVATQYLDGTGAYSTPAGGGGGATNLTYDAATRVIASDTGTDATLPLVTAGDAGLAPASGGGTANFLRADGTWAAPAGSSAALGLADWWESYRITVTTTGPWILTAVNAGTGNTAIPAAALLGHNPGGGFIRSSTTANSGARYKLANEVADYFGGMSHKFRGKALWRATAGNTVRIGFHDSITSADAVDGAYFEVNNDVIACKTSNNSVRTQAITTLILTVNRVYTFDIDVNAAGTSARFRVYENLNATPVLDQTITTNIPNTTARTFGAGCVATNSGTVAADIIIVYELGMGSVEGFARAKG
jgi:Protein of unknown function (DUF2793)